MSLPKSTAEYRNLEVIAEPLGLAYGPVQSRRLGRSLGLNLLGDQKICSFNCPYCELGETAIRMNQLKSEEIFPTLNQIDEAMRTAMRKIAAANSALDCITISGNGEPTLHPQFSDCVELILRARDELLPGKKVVLLTNGVYADTRRMISALNSLDERMLKLDAGGDSLFKKVNSPLVRANVARVTANARKLKDTIIQSLFVQGSIDNTQLIDIEEWLEVVGIVRPKAVHIYTIARVPALAGLKKADEDTLYTIESRLKRKLQVDSSVFP